MFSEVVTVTVSPGVNRVNGRKLAPRPSESPRNVPLCGSAPRPDHGDGADPRDRHAPEDDLALGRRHAAAGDGNTYTCGPARGDPGAGRANANTPIAVSTHASVSDLSAGR